MMISFKIGFDTNKWASDRRDYDIATTKRFLRINAENIVRRNSIW